VLVTFIAAVSKGESPTKAGVAFVVLLGVFAIFSFLANTVLSVVGQSCCVLGPTQPATRAWAVAGLALAVLVVFQGQAAVDLVGDRGDLDPSPGGPRPEVVGLLLTWLFLEVGRLTVLALFLRGVGGERNQRGLTTAATFLAVGTPAAFLLNFLMSFFWHLIVRPNMRSDKVPEFATPGEIDWVGWLLMMFNLISLVVVLLGGVFVMFRAWQALGPRPAVISRRNLA
jgi:hypothetical protein